LHSENAINAIALFYHSLDIKRGQNDEIALIARFLNTLIDVYKLLHTHIHILHHLKHFL